LPFDKHGGCGTISNEVQAAIQAALHFKGRGIKITRLQDPEHPYQSASFLANVKPRDFDAAPFEVKSGLDCRLHFVGDGSAPAVLIKGQGGNKANKDGHDEAARAIIKANLTKTVREIKAALAEAGIRRSDGWISMRRCDIKGTGSRLSE
jgi:hypothetical protein